MIDQMMVSLVRKLSDEDMINENMSAKYTYALITLVEKWLTLGTLLIAGIFFQNVLPMVLFLFVFFTLRNRTGGYHAEKFWQCYVMTVLTFLGITWIGPVLSENFTAVYAAVLLSAVIILVIGTVNHPNMDMNNEELIESKKTARWMVILYSFLILAFAVLGVNTLYLSYMSVGIVLCAMLLCIAKVMKQEVGS
ncbi:MAG: accessory gene regulator B family protein [Lachnospiraceae bacterium]